MSHNFYTDDEGSRQIERTIAVFTVASAWIGVFNWLRMFESTSFYIKLIEMTFVDMWSFLIIFMAMLAMIGCSMYMLQLNARAVSNDVSVIESFAGHFFLDLLYN